MCQPLVSCHSRLFAWVGVLNLCCWALMACPASAVEPDTLRQLANGRTLCIAQVDLARLKLPQEQFSQLQPMLDELRQAAGEQPVVVAVDLPYSSISNGLRIMIQRPTANAEALTRWLDRYGKSLRLTQLAQSDAWITLASVQAEQEPAPVTAMLQQHLSPEMARWQAAWQGLQAYPIQIACVPPSYLQRAFHELEPELPAVLGGGPSRVLINGLQWMHLGIDPSSSTAQLRIQSNDESAAEDLAEHLPTLVQAALANLAHDMELSDTLVSELIGAVQPQVTGSQIAWNLQGGDSNSQFFTLVNAALSNGLRPLSKNRSVNNIKQLMLAMHNYESAFKTLPPHTRFRDEQGRSGLSWRVHILPFIDQAELYRKFKLDEPWDSPHNRQLIEDMPEIYRPVIGWGGMGNLRPYHTLYAGPVGEKTIFGGDEAITFGKISDGTSNTVAIVELAPEHAIPWTAPEDYRFDPQDPAAKLFDRNGQTLVGFMDGSVHSLEVNNPAEVWNGLFTMSGGEVVEPR